MNLHRKQRIEDFRQRASFAPDSVNHHHSDRWPYIPVHQFADETKDVALCVDCWCLLGQDAALLECIAASKSTLEPGLYARIDQAVPNWPKLQAVTSTPLTRAAVESIMKNFVALGFPDNLPTQLYPGDSLSKLATCD